MKDCDSTRNEDINILLSCDGNYLLRARTMLFSLWMNETACGTKPAACRVYLIHSGIDKDMLDNFKADLARMNMTFSDIKIDENTFGNAPITDRYPQEMYYRLLAGIILPRDLHRVLYLDPDILVINPVRKLWQTDLEGHLFAAAAHEEKTSLTDDFNNIRLGTEGIYYNSGVLLMDLDACRERINPDEIFTFIRRHRLGMLLPDQDVLNALYEKDILQIPDIIWNYDARHYLTYKMNTDSTANVEWIISNTSILHFCGRAKPWKEHYPYRFGALYKHYSHLEKRFFEGQ